ncbi:MAG: ion channel [Pseudomonadota bacterium]
MTLPHQILWGSTFLGLCFVIEILLLTWCTLMIVRAEPNWSARGVFWATAGPIATALAFIVATHTIQVWIWAIVWMILDVLPDWNTAIYFSLVSFTTLGYGDVVLGEGLRIFGSFAAVAGLLAFGLSTAYMVALMTRLFNERFFS